DRKSVYFHDLWVEVANIAKLTKEEADESISIFYTDLALDGRFITLGDNVWDLRERHSFDKVHIDMNDIYTSDDEVIESEEGIIAKEDLDEELFEEDVEESKEKKEKKEEQEDSE
ncbi:MAG: DNA-directed RNA polymerase subunit delta, partial [Erysipelotrichales bacterium]